MEALSWIMVSDDSRESIKVGLFRLNDLELEYAWEIHCPKPGSEPTERPGWKCRRKGLPIQGHEVKAARCLGCAKECPHNVGLSAPTQ